MNRRLLVAIALVLAACGDEADLPLGEGVDASVGADAGGRTDGGSGAVDAGVSQPVDLLALARREALATFAASATTAGLESALTGSAPHTVFAPTDEAFDDFAFDAPTDPGLVANLVFNHVVPGPDEPLERIAVGTPLRTLAGTDVELGAAALAGARLSARVDLVATNGRLHVLEQVLRVPRVGELDRARSDLAGFGARLRGASTLAQDPYFGPAPVTVFVPTDAALTAFGTAATDDALVSAHIALGGQRLSAELMAGQRIRLADGSSVEVQVGPQGLELVDGEVRARIVETDIRLANGVVHVISEVLRPRALDVLDVMAQEGLTTLRAAVTAANLEVTLRGEGPFTVFAPTDAALAAVRGMLPGDPTLLANILLTHVVPGRVASTALGTEVTTAARTRMPVTDRGGVRVGGAPLSTRVSLEAGC